MALSLPALSRSIWRCQSVIWVFKLRSSHSFTPKYVSNPSATVMAAALTKNAVCTTLVSGNRSTLRNLGCHVAMAGVADASLFFFSRDNMSGGRGRGGLVVGHQAEESEPADVLGVFRQRVRQGDLARMQPRHRVELEARDAERAGDRDAQ